MPPVSIIVILLSACVVLAVIPQRQGQADDREVAATAIEEL